MGLGQNNSIIDQDIVSSIRDVRHGIALVLARLIRVQYTAASTVLTVIALYLAKVSMVMLIGRLFTKSVRTYWIVVAVFGLVSAIQIEAGCVYPTCTNVAPRYYAYAALDIATELVVLALPTHYIQNVRMKRKRKTKVLLTFSSRALIILFAALIIWAATRVLDTGNFTTSITLPVILLQLELGLSIIICAIIPCFRMIFQSSDVILSSAEASRETKRPRDSHQQNSQQLRSYGENLTTTAVQTDTQISYQRQPTPPPPVVPRKPEHNPQSSQDSTMGASEGTRQPSESRASESSLVPSGTTGLSSKPLFQAPIP